MPTKDKEKKRQLFPAVSLPRPCPCFHAAMPCSHATRGAQKKGVRVGLVGCPRVLGESRYYRDGFGYQVNNIIPVCCHARDEQQAVIGDTGTRMPHTHTTHLQIILALPCLALRPVVSPACVASGSVPWLRLACRGRRCQSQTGTPGGEPGPGLT